ncbi:MAG: hypothetical protein ABH842_00230 [Candidatus Micrarchaeota archaeon]
MFAHDCRDKGDGRGKRPQESNSRSSGYANLIRALARVEGKDHLLPSDFGVPQSKVSGNGMANLAAALAKISKPEPEPRRE